MTEQFLQTNEAVALSAVLNGLKIYAGYPITPSSETMEKIHSEFVKMGRSKDFINAFSETEAINILYGASAAGVRCMTATSGCGLSLMREGLSYMVGSHLPCVIYNVMRFSPGLGGITSSNQDISIVWSVGHGQSKVPVITPTTAQEAADCIMYAFDIADVLRLPVIIMCDAILGQMYEVCEIHKSNVKVNKDWVVGIVDNGIVDNKKNTITSRRIISYKTKKDEQEEQIQYVLERENNMLSTCQNIMQYTDLYKYNRDGKYVSGIGTVGRVVQEVAEEIDIGYFVPILLSPMNNSYNIKELTVVEIGGKQLYDIMKYNYPQANVKSITFSHDIPSADEIIKLLLADEIIELLEE